MFSFFTWVVSFVASDAFKQIVKSLLAVGLGAYLKSYFPALTWNSIVLFSLALCWTILNIWFWFIFLTSAIYGSLNKGLIN